MGGKMNNPQYAKNVPGGIVGLIVSSAIVIACATEMCRTISMLIVMHKNDIDKDEPDVYGSIWGSTIVLLAFAGLGTYGVCSWGSRAISLPHVLIGFFVVAVFIYTIRTAGRLVWDMYVCRKHGLKKHMKYKKREGT
jgi:hypothetical protein